MNVKRLLLISIAAICLLPALSATVLAADTDRLPAEMAWPAVTRECRPWTYWWWMGSAVSKPELTRHFEMYNKVGLGGVHVVPIHGVKGYGNRYIDYLSPKWMEMLAHAVAEADRVGMGLDMTTGTGWNFGGPQVGAEDAIVHVTLRTYKLQAGARLGEKLAKDKVQALVAYSDGGGVVDLTNKIGDDGTVDWTAPAGRWELYCVCRKSTGRKVEVAAPGGEGYMLNPFSNRALRNYLARFNKAFAGYRGKMPRAFYNDSYEYYGNNWTDDLFVRFASRRGYKLQEHLPAFFGKGPAAAVSRVRYDYRRTVDELLLEEHIVPWAKWSHDKGCLARNQAHGSPGNILDLYAAADIPETEVFGTTWIQLAGLEIPPGIPKYFGGGPPDLMVNKIASSAAHVAGKRCVGCETSTFLSEHFQVSLAQVKGQVDLLFTTGVNHVVFHGTAFSPEDAPWPGWLFYATTNFGPSNTFWRDLPALYGYVARCQAFLQAGRPDNDVLVYLPIHDLWSKEVGTDHMLHFMGVTNSHIWFRHNLAPVDQAVRMMWDQGFGLDFVSDRMLHKNISVAKGRLQATGSSYRVLVVAGCTIIPCETLQRIVDLARDGATVIVVGELPRDVPGLHDLENRRKRLKEILATVGPMKKIFWPDVHRANVGQGCVMIGWNLETMLDLAGVRRESVVDHGVEFIRRAADEGRVYFMTNLAKHRLDGWVPLAIAAAAAVVFDPMSQQRGLAALRRSEKGQTEVYLQLDPGESLVLKTLDKKIDGPRWRYLSPAGRPQTVSGAWHVEFLEGGPSLPKPLKLEKLESWAGKIAESDASLRAFSGTARYTITFDKPAVEADDWVLDLGRVCESARVKLNGKPIGTVFSRPYRIRLGDALRPGENRLELEVTNLMSNRVRDMDRRGEKPCADYYFPYIVRWRPPRDWEPLPSGLLGPVRLIPMQNPM